MSARCDEHDAYSAVKNKTKQTKRSLPAFRLSLHLHFQSKNKNVVWIRLRSVGLDFRTEWHVGVEVVGCDVEMVLSALEVLVKDICGWM